MSNKFLERYVTCQMQQRKSCLRDFSIFDDGNENGAYKTLNREC